MAAHVTGVLRDGEGGEKTDSQVVCVIWIAGADGLEVVDGLRACRRTDQGGGEDGLADAGVCAKDLVDAEMAEEKGHASRATLVTVFWRDAHT